MKKTLSIILSIVMLFSIATTANLSAYAGGWLAQAKDIEFDTIYTEDCSKSDNDYEVFKFSVPCKSKLNVHMESPFNLYIKNGDLYYCNNVYIYNSNDLENYCWRADTTLEYSSSRGIYYTDMEINLEKGDYYFVISYGFHPSDYEDDYDIIFSIKPIISTPSSFKVSSRGATSLKLSWSKVANVSGYQLQRKSGGSYKTVANTTATSATVSNLSTATNYAFRIRAYKTVDGKKYYGSWKYLTTPTKPSKVSIKAPSTNSKHQIIAKWNKVTRASGYQVQYCKNKACSNVVATKTISGGSKTSYTGKNFTKGKTYYVRVRAYRTVNGTKYYGAWSNVKSIKTK